MGSQEDSTLNPKPAHHPSPSVGRWAPSSASETMAGSARPQSLPTTPLRGRQAWSPSHCITIYINDPKPDKIALARFPTPNPPSGQGVLQMDKGWGGWGSPNPSRLANGQGLGAPNPSRLGAAAPQPLGGQGPPTLHDLQNLQMDKGWAPQPFTTCKWTRVGGPPTPHDLGRQGTPTLHDLQMDKGWGPPQPFTTCKWTRAPQPLTTWGGRAPNPSGLEAAEPSTLYDLGWGATNPSPKIGKPVTGPFGPELSPNAKPKFSSWCDI